MFSVGGGRAGVKAMTMTMLSGLCFQLGGGGRAGVKAMTMTMLSGLCFQLVNCESCGQCSIGIPMRKSLRK